MAATTGLTSKQKLDLVKIIEDLFMVLSPKEKEVVVKRFSLNNEPRQTLESIGQSFSVTRERIRQIEKIALSKLKRTAPNTKLSMIHQLGSAFLADSGKMMHEDELVSKVLRAINSVEPTDAHIVKLALEVAPDIIRVEKAKKYYPFWRLDTLPEALIDEITTLTYQYLNKKKDVAAYEETVSHVKASLKTNGTSADHETVVSAFAVDLRFKLTNDGIGLAAWRHINPRSIRDKAYIILKHAEKPLHFIEIANKISEAHFDKKLVTIQAVHNELIRDEAFVLVGRGLYGLKEWGFKRGTVADIIEDLLSRKSPLSKHDIVAGVLKQRHVKKGTISLNLQKNPHFIRVGRAVYELDLSKKPKVTSRRRGGLHA